MIPFIRDAPGAGWYVSEWKRGKAATAAGGTVRVAGSWHDLDAVAFDRFMLAALNRRINLRGGLAEDGVAHTGRRTAPDYQTELQRDAWELQGHQARRTRLWGLNGRRWRTDVVQRRFGHLLAGREDY